MTDDTLFADAPPLKKAVPNGRLLELANKLAPKWAETYVDLYVKKGSPAAKLWAAHFLGGNKTYLGLLKVEAEKLMKKRGIYKEKTPDGAA